MDSSAWGYVRNYQQVADNGNDLKYCGSLGHPSGNSTGLIYMRARYYDPLLGRFISEDPARDGANWYAYAENNPVSFSDPSGKSVAALLPDPESFGAWATGCMTTLGMKDALAQRIGSAVAEHYGALLGHLMAT